MEVGAGVTSVAEGLLSEVESKTVSRGVSGRRAKRNGTYEFEGGYGVQDVGGGPAHDDHL